jgi:hypothetical protein
LSRAELAGERLSAARAAAGRSDDAMIDAAIAELAARLEGTS